MGRGVHLTAASEESPPPATSGAGAAETEAEGESYVSIDPGIDSKELEGGEARGLGMASQAGQRSLEEINEKSGLLKEMTCPSQLSDSCAEADGRKRSGVLAVSVIAFLLVVVCGTVYALRSQQSPVSRENRASHASESSSTEAWPEPVAGQAHSKSTLAALGSAAASAKPETTSKATVVRDVAAEAPSAASAPAAPPAVTPPTFAPAPTFAPSPGVNAPAARGKTEGWEFVPRGAPDSGGEEKQEAKPSHPGSSSATLVWASSLGDGALDNSSSSAQRHSEAAGNQSESALEGESGNTSLAPVLTAAELAEAREEQMMEEINNRKKHVGCKLAMQKERQAVDGGEGTVEKWGQCGGEGYEGDTRCQKGLYCKKKPLPQYDSYRQCVPDNRDRCEDMQDNKDSACWHKVTWDMEVGIIQKPEMYNGLTARATWQDFQQQNHNFLEQKSGCPAPCAAADSSCFEVLNIEGCDSVNEFACTKADNTLAFDCCCRKYHPKNSTTWAAAEKAQAAPIIKTPTLFCVALVMPDSYEVELMRAQFELGIGIFDSACDAWAVFSNETISMNCGSNDTKFDTTVMGGSLEAPRGGEYNTAMNTAVFERFWDAVIWDGRAQSYDWLVKVDADTLFFPGRLKQILKKNLDGGKEPPSGLFLNDCHLGMHGPIEVFGKEALKSYAQGKKDCVHGEAGQHGQEDVYLRQCFKQLGVTMVDAFNILLEGMNACEEKPSAAADQPLPPCFAPEAAFHPFKTIRSMMHCWAEAITVETSELDMTPISDPPSIWNGRHTYIHT